MNPGGLGYDVELGVDLLGLHGRAGAAVVADQPRNAVERLSSVYRPDQARERLTARSGDAVAQAGPLEDPVRGDGETRASKHDPFRRESGVANDLRDCGDLAQAGAADDRLLFPVASVPDVEIAHPDTDEVGPELAEHPGKRGSEGRHQERVNNAHLGADLSVQHRSQDLEAVRRDKDRHVWVGRDQQDPRGVQTLAVRSAHAIDLARIAARKRCTAPPLTRADGTGAAWARSQEGSAGPQRFFHVSGLRKNAR